MLRYRQPPRANDDARDPALQKHQNVGRPSEDDRDVQNRLESVTHGAQCQCPHCGLGLEQVHVGRALAFVLGAREVGAFQGNSSRWAEFSANFSQALRVVSEFPAAQSPGMLLQVLLRRVAA